MSYVAGQLAGSFLASIHGTGVGVAQEVYLKHVAHCGWTWTVVGFGVSWIDVQQLVGSNGLSKHQDKAAPGLGCQSTTGFILG